MDSAQATAVSLRTVLQDLALLNDDPGALAQVSYLVTDSVNRFQSVGAIFLGEELPVESIELVDARV